MKVNDITIDLKEFTFNEEDTLGEAFNYIIDYGYDSETNKYRSFQIVSVRFNTGNGIVKITVLYGDYIDWNEDFWLG